MGLRCSRHRGRRSARCAGPAFVQSTDLVDLVSSSAVSDQQTQAPPIVLDPPRGPGRELVLALLATAALVIAFGHHPAAYVLGVCWLIAAWLQARACAQPWARWRARDWRPIADREAKAPPNVPRIALTMLSAIVGAYAAFFLQSWTVAALHAAVFAPLIVSRDQLLLGPGWIAHRWGSVVVCWRPDDIESLQICRDPHGGETFLLRRPGGSVKVTPGSDGWTDQVIAMRRALALRVAARLASGEQIRLRPGLGVLKDNAAPLGVLYLVLIGLIPLTMAISDGLVVPATLGSLTVVLIGWAVWRWIGAIRDRRSLTLDDQALWHGDTRLRWEEVSSVAWRSRTLAIVGQPPGGEPVVLEVDNTTPDALTLVDLPELLAPDAAPALSRAQAVEVARDAPSIQPDPGPRRSHRALVWTLFLTGALQKAEQTTLALIVGALGVGYWVFKR